MNGGRGAGLRLWLWPWRRHRRVASGEVTPETEPASLRCRIYDHTRYNLSHNMHFNIIFALLFEFRGILLRGISIICYFSRQKVFF